MTGRLLGLPLVLEYRIVGGKPAGGKPAGGETARFRSVHLGRLPLVPPFKWIATGYLPDLLSGLRHERQIVQHLAALEIDGAGIEVEVAPKPQVTASTP